MRITLLLFSFLAVAGIAAANSLPLFYNWMDNNQGGQGGEIYYQYSTDNIAYSNQTWTAGPPAGWKHDAASFDIVRTAGGDGNISIYSGFGASQGYEAIAWKPPANTTINGLYNITGTATSIQAGTFKVSIYNYSETGSSTLLATYAFTGTGQIKAISVTGINVTTAGFIRIVLDNQGDSTNDQVNLTDVEIKGPPGFVRYLVLRGYDELASTSKKQLVVTITNSTNNTAYPATTSNVFFAPVMAGRATVPINSIVVSVQNSTCQTGNVLPRVFSYTTGTDDDGYNAFLICDGATAVSQNMIVTDTTNVPIQDATITIFKVIGTQQTISVLKTDAVGLASSYLIASNNYIVTASKFGYNTNTITLTATGNPITIPLSLANATQGYVPVINFDWIMSPPAVLSYPILQVNISVTPFYGFNVTYYALNLSLQNGTQLYFANYTNITGGPIISDLINSTGWNSTFLYADLRVGQPGLSEWEFTRTFTLNIYNDTNSSLTWLAANFKNSGVTPSMAAVISLFGALFISIGAASIGMGMAGAGVIFVVAFAFLGSITGFVEEYLIYILLILSIAIYSLNKNW